MDNLNTKKIGIWGTGKASRDFLDEAILKNDVEIVAYIKEYPDNYEHKGIKIYNAYELAEIELDYLIIASQYTDDIILSILKKCPHLIQKTIVLNATELSHKYTKGMLLLGEIVENTFLFRPRFAKEREIRSKRMEYDYVTDTMFKNTFLFEKTSQPTLDYTRYRTFELIADEINKKGLIGDVAEVGVFRGEFAKIINYKFQDRKLYLFDTFEGYIQEEIDKESKLLHCEVEFIEKFSNTSINLVMRKMITPENCIIREGYCPETAIGIDTKYVFVSIDVNFEESTFLCLEHFYPLVVKGGFLFIHDYNSISLRGVRKAIERFEEKYGELIKLPISDSAGTLIIYKND